MSAATLNLLSRALGLPTNERGGLALHMLHCLKAEGSQAEHDEDLALELRGMVEVHLRQVWESSAAVPPEKPQGGREEILQTASQLPAASQSALAEALILSLEERPFDPPEVVEAAWAEEIRRRLARIESGEDRLVPWEEVRDRLEARLGRQEPS